VTNNESLTGAYYGYQLDAAGYEEGTSVYWGHTALRKVCGASEVDFLCSPGSNYDPSLPQSLMLHGKIFITENDASTFVTETDSKIAELTRLPGEFNMQEVQTHFFDTRSFSDYHQQRFPGSAPYTQKQSLWDMKRQFSHRFIKREGMWWRDLFLSGGWYHHPDIVRFLKRTSVLYEKSRHLDLDYKAEVAVIIDEQTPFYLKPTGELLYSLIRQQDGYANNLCGLPRMGTTYDFFFHDDLSDPGMPEYKMYIFLNTIYLTEREREEIKKVIRKDNKVAVWVYAPGVISDKGISESSIRDLTGVDVKLWDNTQLHGNLSDYTNTSKVFITDYSHPITRDADPMVPLGTDIRISPGIRCDDAGATVLGRICVTENLAYPGFVLKEFDNWKSVYSTVPNIPAKILGNTARYAGCHMYSTDNDLIFANNYFLSANSIRAGDRKIFLPKRTNVYEAFTERPVASDAEEFTDSFSPGETKLYFLGDISLISDEASRFEI
jgi:hypothetical protein